MTKRFFSVSEEERQERNTLIRDSARDREGTFMATEIQIRQGDQIGGCVTIITYAGDGVTVRLMIDYGMSLPGAEQKEEYEHDWEKEPVDAVLFTHYHGDHAGRFREVPARTRLYLGAASRAVMINIYQALARARDQRTASSAREALAVLQDDIRIAEVKRDTPMAVGPVTVTGYEVDHSAYDAYMYLIETPDKTILHTGDFRGHGYRGKALLPMTNWYIRRNGRRDVDILITEGTMMSRRTEIVKTEAELQAEARKYFREHRYAFLICSSTNLDSLASFYQAARANGMYLYTYSNYVCQQLRTFTELAGARTELYQFEEVYVLRPDQELHHKAWSKPRKQKELMREHGFLALIKPEDFCEKYINEFLDLKPVIVYSMWDGYLKPEEAAYIRKWDAFLKRQQAKGVEVKHLHTGGHATAEQLTQLIKEVNPREAICPIHTEHAEGFYELELPQELKERISWKGDCGVLYKRAMDERLS